MSLSKIALGAIALIVAGTYLGNASWLAEPVDQEMSLLAHRGVHQTFHTRGLTAQSCTATRIDAPTHAFLENTVPSIAEAVRLGADMVEIDIHPTTDGHFAVFHDWTLDCRTNGAGRTRDKTLVELQALDIGFGYTADKGGTFPFRGKYVGMMPSLTQVLDNFPETHFVINIKGGEGREGAKLASFLTSRGDHEWHRLSFVGHHAPMATLSQNSPNVVIQTRRTLKACLKEYVMFGWAGHVPQACRGTYVPVPENYRWLIWGWPHRFEQRLASVGSRSMLIGPMADGHSTGIDTDKMLRSVPTGYRGIVYTNKIEIIGPALRRDNAIMRRAGSGH